MLDLVVMVQGNTRQGNGAGLPEGLSTKMQARLRGTQEGGRGCTQGPTCICCHCRGRRQGQERLLKLSGAATMGEVSPTGSLEEDPGSVKSGGRGKEPGAFISQSFLLPLSLDALLLPCFALTNQEPEGRAWRSASRLVKVEKG